MKLSERMKQRDTATDETPSFGTVSTRAAGQPKPRARRRTRSSN